MTQRSSDVNRLVSLRHFEIYLFALADNAVQDGVADEYNEGSCISLESYYDGHCRCVMRLHAKNGKQIQITRTCNPCKQNFQH
jgi:hypothetical protein